ncbi:MAG: hypothetical protein AVDCRST_MAG01-01-4793, partial [uncultured Rubrobacteraceae bacterium]
VPERVIPEATRLAGRRPIRGGCGCLGERERASRGRREEM